MTKIRLEQLPGTKDNDQSGSKDHQAKGLMNQNPDDINSKMEKGKMKRVMRMIKSLQLKKRAKTRIMIKMIMMLVILRRNQAGRKEGWSRSAWVVKSFNSISSLLKDSLFVLKQKLQKEAEQAQKRLVELDALRREYQQTVYTYQDLYQQYRDEHGVYPLYENMPMRLGGYKSILRGKDNLCI